MSDRLSAAAIVLGGGLSTRMGVDKTTLLLGGRTLTDIVLDTVAGMFSQTIIVTNEPGDPTSRSEIDIARDEVPHLGPLGGIAAGLRASDWSHNFVVACDMPFLNAEFIRYLVAAGPTADVVLPVTDRRQTLHAVYATSCYEAITEQMAAGDYRIRSLFDHLNVVEVSEETARSYDKDLLCFFNVNSPEDYEKAKVLFERSRRRVENPS